MPILESRGVVTFTVVVLDTVFPDSILISPLVPVACRVKAPVTGILLCRSSTPLVADKVVPVDDEMVPPPAILSPLPEPVMLTAPLVELIDETVTVDGVDAVKEKEPDEEPVSGPWNDDWVAVTVLLALVSDSVEPIRLPLPVMVNPESPLTTS